MSRTQHWELPFKLATKFLWFMSTKGLFAYFVWNYILERI